MWVEQATSLFWSATCRYLFSGSGCRAATTPPRAAAERLAQTARFARSLRAAGRGATRRSATSSTTLNRYTCRPEWDGRPVQTKTVGREPADLALSPGV